MDTILERLVTIPRFDGTVPSVDVLTSSTSGSSIKTRSFTNTVKPSSSSVRKRGERSYGTRSKFLKPLKSGVLHATDVW